MSIQFYISILRLLFILSFVFSCSTTQEEESKSDTKYSKTLTLDGEKVFRIDESVTFSPYRLQYFDDGQQEYLLIGNANILSVDVYLLDSSRLIHRLYINDSSAMLTKDMAGFTLANKDTLFAFGRYQMSPILLTLNDWTVTSRQRIKVVNPNTETYLFNHASMTASPSIGNL